MKTLIITGLISSLLMMASCHKEDQKEEQKLLEISSVIELEGILIDYNTGITSKNIHSEKSKKVIESLIDEAFELAEEDKKKEVILKFFFVNDTLFLKNKRSTVN